MRKLLWITLAALFVSVGASNANADSYTVTFQCNGSCVAPVPVVTNNPVAFPFPTLDVSWQGVGFVLTFDPILPGVVEATDIITWEAFQNNYSLGPNVPIYSSNLEVILMDTRTSHHAIPGFVSIGIPGSNAPGDIDDSGILVISRIPTPEPSSVALMLVGIGFLLVLLRKRKGHGLHMAS
jgi:hypothetical protein